VTHPLIGITVGDGDSRGRHGLRVDYVRSVEQAGGVPVALPPAAAHAALLLAGRLDGLVLSGGGDLDPAHFGAPRHPRLGRVDARRDAFELALVRAALERDLPLLAICRGQQLLNVARGGTLLQDIPSELEGAGEHDGKRPRSRCSHDVQLLPHSRLRSILGRDTLAVNSFHHQAVDRLGDGVHVSARCPADGVIEAVEMPSQRFVVGVQWHPELMPHSSVQMSFFRALVTACRGEDSTTTEPHPDA
jgi:putative glutamine amidotransferase